MSHSAERPAGEVFLDARGHGRALRLTWHHDKDLVVLSLWRNDVCVGSFRLGLADVNDFVDALVEGMRDAPGVHPSRPEATHGSAVPEPRAADDDALMPVTGQTAVKPRAADEHGTSFTDWASDDTHRADAG